MTRLTMPAPLMPSIERSAVMPSAAARPVSMLLIIEGRWACCAGVA